ncbi:hypothetical protein G3497_08475 [Shewanella baltica]|nr:hypothetical protein [Shewanella baltica]
MQHPTNPSGITKHQVYDVVALAQNQDWKTLNEVIICQDIMGNVVAHFGENRWDISPYISGRGNYKTTFDFTNYAASPPLLLELKLIVYGWLYHRSSRTNQASKPVSLITRFSKLKTTYNFLLQGRHSSLSALSVLKVWIDFENTLVNANYAQPSLSQIFGSINASLLLQSWLKVDFGFNTIKSKMLSQKLSTKKSQQTLVIPELLADAIYGKAIELVTFAHTNIDTLVLLKCALQENYLEGKAIVDNKIKLGIIKYLTDESGNIIHNQEYTNQIIKHQPEPASRIIKRNLCSIKGWDSDLNNGNHLQRYFGQLIAACYICCGAFSGMRDSEIGELTTDSYYRETIGGRDFHMLQSHTFKLGEKNDTWVAAPIAQKAIELAAGLTQQLREMLSTSSETLIKTLWLSQMFRNKPPTIICDWNERLRRFCQQFNFVVTQADYQECLKSNPLSQAKIDKTIQIGKAWPLTSHQFRRSLAFYTIKHRLGTTISLKQQFKHLYLQMTEWYTNGAHTASLMNLNVDSELQAILDSARKHDTTNKFFNMMHSDQLLSGTHGKAIMAMRDNIPHIYSSRDIIYNAVQKGTLTLHGSMHSYCKNGYNCDMDGVVNPAFCVECSSDSSIIDEENAKWWQAKHHDLTNYLSNLQTVSPSIYSHCITQIRAAEIVMKDFGMDYTPYKHPVEIVEL